MSADNFSPLEINIWQRYEDSGANVNVLRPIILADDISAEIPKNKLERVIFILLV